MKKPLTVLYLDFNQDTIHYLDQEGYLINSNITIKRASKDKKYNRTGYLYVRCSGSITSVGEDRAIICLLLFTCNYVVSVREVSSSSGCLGWAALFYCDTP